MSRSYQGHLKVKIAKIFNKKHFSHFFVAKECSTRLQLTYCDWESLPTRILGVTVNIMCLGGVIPHPYIPRPLLYHKPLPTLKSMQKMVNWSFVEHGLVVTKHMRHPHLGTKGDMRWGCTLLGFYCRVRSRSYKGHFKGKADQLLNRNTFYSFHVFSGYWWPYCFDDTET